MKRVWLAVVVGLASVGGVAFAGTQITTLKSSPAKAYPCDLDFYESQDEIQRPFEKLAVIAIDDTAFFGASAKVEALAKLKKAACKAGADGIIVKGWAGNEEGEWHFHQGPGHESVEAVAIKYLQVPANSVPAGQAPGTRATAQLWHSFSDAERRAFLFGLADGVWVGRVRTLARIIEFGERGTPEAKDGASRALEVVGERDDAFPDLSSDDLGRAFDEFYSHPENANVRFSDASTTVVLKRAGLKVPAEVLEGRSGP